MARASQAVKEIIFPSPDRTRREELEESIRYARVNLEDSERFIARIHKQSEEHREQLEQIPALEKFIESELCGEEGRTTVLTSYLRDAIRNYQDVALQHGRNASVQIERRERHNAERKKRIAEYEAELASIPEPRPEDVPKLTLKDAKNALKNIESISPQSIALRQRNSGHYYIKWRFSGLKYRPSNNPYGHICGGEIPAIPVPDCSVRVNLTGPNKGKVTITKHPKESQEKLTYYYEGETVHPHVLNSRGKPCFGDFSSPLADAIHDKAIPDLETVAVVLELFLSQADDDDAAGRKWINYFQKRAEFGGVHVAFGGGFVCDNFGNPGDNFTLTLTDTGEVLTEFHPREE